MQILANALPGFRDLRAPLTAGYMWLLFAWLWASPDLDTMTTGFGGSLHDLSERAGSIWTALAAGVGAYLIGSISQAASGFLQRAVMELPPFRFRFRNLASPTHRRLLASFEEGRVALKSAKLMGSPSADRLEAQLADRFEEASREAQRELDLPATLLVGDQMGLFAEVDRVRAEGELRMAVLPPLVALGVLLGHCGSAWWYLLIPAALLLFYQGIQRDFDAKKIISDAIWMERVQASSVTKFSQWVKEDIIPLGQ